MRYFSYFVRKSASLISQYFLKHVGWTVAPLDNGGNLTQKEKKKVCHTEIMSDKFISFS